MPVLNEKVAEDKVVKWARRCGILVTKMNLLGQRSWPDRVFWITGGSPVLIEFKRVGKKPTPLQANTIKNLRKAGYDVQVSDSADQAIRYLECAIREATTVETRSIHADVRALSAGTLQRRIVARPWNAKDKHNAGHPKRTA